MRILITAGPTREPIDAVRFIGNRSSGAMGLALAQAAAEAGHDTTLLVGPGVNTDSQAGAAPASRLYCFESSAQLKQLLEAHWPDHDTLIMAAAVADYRPCDVAVGKLPRRAGETLTLQLQPTPDLVALLAQVKRPDQRIIAFALEQANQLENRAMEKLRRKRVDAIVANPLGTMESPDISPVWLTAGGDRQSPGRMSKIEFARWLVQVLPTLW